VSELRLCPTLALLSIRNLSDILITGTLSHSFVEEIQLLSAIVAGRGYSDGRQPQGRLRPMFAGGESSPLLCSLSDTGPSRLTRHFFFLPNDGLTHPHSQYLPFSLL